MPAIHEKGRSRIRDVLKAALKHVGLSTDTTAFDDADTVLDPANGGAGTLIIKEGVVTDIDANTYRTTISINNRGPGNDEFEDVDVATIGLLGSADRNDTVSRTLRTRTVGLEDNDLADFAVDVIVEDNTP